MYSFTEAEHVSHLAQFLTCLHDSHFFVKLSKCHFCQHKVEYLGHLVSAGIVQADPQKLEAMMHWPQPKNIKQLRGFLGLEGYYRRFIRGFASITAPLTDLLRKDAFTWTFAATDAFLTLKQAMLVAPVLKLPDFNADFILETEASNLGIGAVLMQASHPISYFSKKLVPKMQATFTYIKELYAISDVVHKWR